jgi:hypothetical protein
MGIPIDPRSAGIRTDPAHCTRATRIPRNSGYSVRLLLRRMGAELGRLPRIMCPAGNGGRARGTREQGGGTCLLYRFDDVP